MPPATASIIQRDLGPGNWCCLHSRAHHVSLAQIWSRANEPGECAASECSLLCNDFMRLGYSRVVVDPGVRMAYEVFAAQNVYTGLNEINETYVRVPVTKWREIQANPIDESMTAMRPMYK